MSTGFKMVAKTMKGLEATLADELRKLGADNVAPGHRMVSFEGDLELMYRANLCLRTALRVLKPIYTFTANNTDRLYDALKEFDWSRIMNVDTTFAVDVVMNSDTFTHSRFVTYRAKDAIVDWFRDRTGSRPGIRIGNSDILINIHINNDTVTVLLDSSGESLHKRGWRVATTEAPINEVLAAGILLMSGYDGSQPLLDPMCGSGTFLVEAALIAANINPGVFRRKYAFQNWPDYDPELFESLWNNDSAERTPENIIQGSDVLPSAIEVTRRNLTAAGVARYVDVKVENFASYTQAPAPSGILVMNPPYGLRISAPDMQQLYTMIGSQLKFLFGGWTAWIISSNTDYFRDISLAASEKIALLNGSVECQLRKYVMFSGSKRDFRAAGGKLKDVDKNIRFNSDKKRRTDRFNSDKEPGKNKKGRPPRSDSRTNFNTDGFAANRTPQQVADRAFASENRDPSENSRIRQTLIDRMLNQEPKSPELSGVKTIMRSRGWKKKSDS